MEIQNLPSWNDLGLSPEMLNVISQIGYKKPTPVQATAVPSVMQGQDLLVSSQTGSGKTACFVIPSVERFKGKNGTFILALSPTREIAQQTGAVFESFASAFGMKVCVCIGGASIPVEKEALAASPHIIVATPGRLCDHLERGHVWLDFIQCLIFDEADRMLEMGFAKQIETITGQIPTERQTLMFSATFAPAVEKLAKKSMRNPKEIIMERTAESAPKIDQRLFWIPEEKKLSNLLRILRQEKGTMFVFVKAKERAYQVWRSLHNAGFEDVTYIHSDLPQDAREQSVADFKSGKYRVIVATDVMGRGIDVDEVAHVVNYDVPREPEDYIHRIGRTGRRGLTGRASTFAVPGKDKRLIEAIEKLRGVPAPKPESNMGPIREHSGGPREQRRPREPKEREQRPARQHHRAPTPESAPRPSTEITAAPAQLPKEILKAEVKRGGFVQWVKSLFQS